MKKHRLAFLAILFSSTLLVAGRPEAKHIKQTTSSPPETIVAPAPSPVTPPATPPTAVATEPGAKTIQYGEKDVVKLKTKVRFTTLIVLPQNEQILDFIVGDREFWQINGNQNFAMVKPSKEGAMTNLNLITASGNVYTFVVQECSELPHSEPDQKVFIQPKEESMLTGTTKAPRFVPASDLDIYKNQLNFAKEETERIKKDADARVDREVAKFVDNLNMSYKFDPDKAPFHAEAIYTDGKFTFIRLKPDETPTLYEIREGKPNLVNFDYKNGLLTAQKVIDRGYLAIGKDRLLFMRTKNHGK